MQNKFDIRYCRILFDNKPYYMVKPYELYGIVYLTKPYHQLVSPIYDNRRHFILSNIILPTNVVSHDDYHGILHITW